MCVFICVHGKLSQLQDSGHAPVHVRACVHGKCFKCCVHHYPASLANWQVWMELRHEKGWPEPFIYTVYDRMYGDFTTKNTVYTPYIPISVWFGPTGGIRPTKLQGCAIVSITCAPAWIGVCKITGACICLYYVRACLNGSLQNQRGVHMFVLRACLLER